MRAFDARTGALRWSWDPIPSREPIPLVPRGRGPPAPHGRRQRVVDDVGRRRRAVSVPADEQPEPGLLRRRAARRQSLRELGRGVARETGEVVWHFQIVHHDLWDYDVPAQPTLVSVTRAGHDGRCGGRRAPRWGISSSCIARPASRCFPSMNDRCRGARARRRGFAHAAVPRRAAASAGAAAAYARRRVGLDAWIATRVARDRVASL